MAGTTPAPAYLRMRRPDCVGPPSGEAIVTPSGSQELTASPPPGRVLIHNRIGAIAGILRLKLRPAAVDCCTPVCHATSACSAP